MIFLCQTNDTLLIYLLFFGLTSILNCVARLLFIKQSAYFAISTCNSNSTNDFCFRNCPSVGVYDQDEQYQVVNYNSRYVGTKNAFHTLFHILGRYHEHQRPDRISTLG